MRFNNTFLDAYLEYVEDTESPLVFHIWAGLAGMGACLGRRTYFPMGRLRIFPNEYILLVGPPGVRKSDAISIMRNLVAQQSTVRFAPDDTSGQRQGLIVAMQGQAPPEDESVLQLLQTESDRHDLGGNALDNIIMNVDDAHTMFVAASEFTTFVGLHSTDMITFLLKMYDGEDYDYRLKNEMRTLHNPLLGMIGGTTPISISVALPPDAIGGGFMSRMMLVYGNKKNKDVPWPKELNQEIGDYLRACYKYAALNIAGPMSYTPQAKEALIALYRYQVAINDPRFVYYLQRRHTHLIKCVMALCAAEQSTVIQVSHVETAQALMRVTEDFMPDALGEFGLSELSAAKNRLLEFIQNSSPAPVYLSTIMAVMKRDMKPVDLMNSLTDLCNAGKLKMIMNGDAYIYIDKNEEIKRTIDSILAAEIAEA